MKHKRLQVGLLCCCQPHSCMTAMEECGGWPADKLFVQVGMSVGATSQGQSTSVVLTTAVCDHKHLALSTCMVALQQGRSSPNGSCIHGCQPVLCIDKASTRHASQCTVAHIRDGDGFMCMGPASGNRSCLLPSCHCTNVRPCHDAASCCGFYLVLQVLSWTVRQSGIGSLKSETARYFLPVGCGGSALPLALTHPFCS